MAFLRSHLLCLALAFVCLGSMQEMFVESQENITLTCTDSQMYVDIPRSLLTDNMWGNDVRMENADEGDCLGTDIDNVTIRVTTNLTACGTNMTENNTHEVYTNAVVNNGLSLPITRMFHIDIPLACSYERGKRVGSVNYTLTDYTIDKDIAEEGAYSFTFEIYTSSDYDTPVTSYPYLIGLNEPLYFAADVLSPGGSLDLWIQACRATPDSIYDNPAQYNFIENGCADSDSDTALTEMAHNKVGVEIQTFRFTEEGEYVYIHCDLLVCDAADTESLCNTDCAAPATRRRRDVSSALETKRFTRGPLRVIRAAESKDSISRSDLSESDVSQQKASSVFNPWMIAMAVMATVVMALVAMMVVVLRKVNSMPTFPKKENEEI